MFLAVWEGGPSGQLPLGVKAPRRGHDKMLRPSPIDGEGIPLYSTAIARPSSLSRTGGVVFDLKAWQQLIIAVAGIVALLSQTEPGTAGVAEER